MLALELEMACDVYCFTPQILQMWAQVRKYYTATGCFCSYHESCHTAKVKVN